MADPQHRPFDDAEDDAFHAAVQEGIDAADAGETVPYKDVRRWVLSWGTDNELPPVRT